MNERIRELHNKVFAESMNMRWNIEDAAKKAGAAIRYAMEAHDVARGYVGLVSIANHMTQLAKEIDALGPLLPGKSDDKEAA